MNTLVSVLPNSIELSYATSKRLLIPGWWVEGLLVKHGANELLCLNELNQKHVYWNNQDIDPKFFKLLCLIWSNLCALALTLPENTQKASIPLKYILKGTATQISEQIQFLEDFWGSGYKILTPQSSKSPLKKSGLSVSWKTKGTEQFLTGHALEREPDPILHFFFRKDIQDFCFGPDHSKMISINPDMISSLSKGKTLHKILSYLAMEYGKTSESQDYLKNFIVTGISTKTSSFHKENLKNSMSYYDHGICGWNILPPSLRLKDIKKDLQKRTGLNEGKGAIICCWNKSEHLHNAIYLETQLTLMLTHKSHEVAVIPSSKVNHIESKEKKNSSHEKETLSNIIPLKQNQETIFKKEEIEEIKAKEKIQEIKSKRTKKSEPLPQVSYDWVLLSKLYTKLNSREQKIFEYEQKHRSEEEFIKYIQPLIKKYNITH